MTNIIFTRIKDENILPEFEGCLVEVEVDEESERNCGTEEDDPASKKSVLSFSAYRMRLSCSKSALRSIDDS
jgi:hypothetical protein